MQFSAAVFPYIIRVVSSTNPSATVSWSLSNVSSSSDIKNRNGIGDRGDPCGIPVRTRVRIDL